MGWVSGKAIKRELRYYRVLATDRRVPVTSRALIWLGVAYFLHPFDLIPDFVPLLGQLDDAILVPSLISLGYFLIPKDLRIAIRREIADEPA